MSLWFSYPEEEQYRKLTARLQQFYGKNLIRWSSSFFFSLQRMCYSKSQDSLLHTTLECNYGETLVEKTIYCFIVSNLQNKSPCDEHTFHLYQSFANQMQAKLNSLKRTMKQSVFVCVWERFCSVDQYSSVGRGTCPEVFEERFRTLLYCNGRILSRKRKGFTWWSCERLKWCIIATLTTQHWFCLLLFRFL